MTGVPPTSTEADARAERLSGLLAEANIRGDRYFEQRNEAAAEAESHARLSEGRRGALADALAALAVVEAQLDEILRAARVAHRGPNDTDASGMTAAADRLEGHYEVGGSNTRAAVVRVLRAVAAVSSSATPEGRTEQ